LNTCRPACSGPEAWAAGEGQGAKEGRIDGGCGGPSGLAGLPAMLNSLSTSRLERSVTGLSRWLSDWAAVTPVRAAGGGGEGVSGGQKSDIDLATGRLCRREERRSLLWEQVAGEDSDIIMGIPLAIGLTRLLCTEDYWNEATDIGKDLEILRVRDAFKSIVHCLTGELEHSIEGMAAFNE